jgi:hypothetical protein
VSTQREGAMRIGRFLSACMHGLCRVDEELLVRGYGTV